MTKEELVKEAEDYVSKYEGWGWKPHEGSAVYWAMLDSYLAGAEPREKRIAELIALINAERERQEKCDDIHLRKIADLEKENAELKAFKEKCKFNVSDICKEIEIENNLIKAKELLKEFIFLLHNPRTALDTKTVMDKAEQFLSEVDK